MSNLKKILIVCGCGAVVWGLSYCASLYSTYSLVFASFSAGVTALCGILTGFSGSSK